jgi:hypothetical protein
MKHIATLAVLVVSAAGLSCGQKDAAGYAPSIDPASFTTNITNQYFSLPVGKTLTYDGQTDEGAEHVEIVVTNDTRTIMGVTTRLYHDQVRVNGKLQEDTRDWLAQDRRGDVWYFGEEVDNYENGQFQDHGGSWTAGVDGALPGIWMKAKQVVGDAYRQEYYRGRAEDMRKIVAVDQTVATGLATYRGCVETYDWTPLEPDLKERKYYCPEVGGEVVTEDLGEGTKLELTRVVIP